MGLCLKHSESFNDYVDKKRWVGQRNRVGPTRFPWVGCQKLFIFVLVEGWKCPPRGRWLKDGKIVST